MLSGPSHTATTRRMPNTLFTKRTSSGVWRNTTMQSSSVAQRTLLTNCSFLTSLHPLSLSLHPCSFPLFLLQSVRQYCPRHCLPPFFRFQHAFFLTTSLPIYSPATDNTKFAEHERRVATDKLGFARRLAQLFFTPLVNAVSQLRPLRTRAAGGKSCGKLVSQ